MSVLITVIVVLVVAGVAVWLLSFLPMDAQIARLVRGVVIIVAVLYVLTTLWQHRGSLLP